jgi:predicted CoA-substrate-specific enzyme activase
MERSIGICLGASTLSFVERTARGIRIERLPHGGEVGQRFSDLVAGLQGAKIGITGRKFRKLLAVPTVSEPEAVELAFEYLRPHYPTTDCIVSAGGEMFIAYGLDAQGRIKKVHTGNKCAAGTGEFFLQQIRRMGLGIEEALELAKSVTPYTVAGRCSVFCKSDCTHALNKGVPKGQVVAGLCQMMAGKILELLHRTGAQRVALIGGVSRNRLVVDLLQESFPQIFVPDEAEGFEALGALLWAEKDEGRGLMEGDIFLGSSRSFRTLPPLERGLDLVSFGSLPEGEFYGGDYVLGLDVGSTTTKAVLVRTDNLSIVAGSYLRTDGDPVMASRECYRRILEQIPEDQSPSIIGLGVTGSGRQIAGLHALTDGVVNEIVAHAAAAVHFDPEVETIFEIGGQDAKYTWITNRVASDYAMNEACAAGTGSFLEEACQESLRIGTREIADSALQAEKPPDFSDQCSAFIGSDIKTALQEGVARGDISAGLVYSVCQNYLNRVKGNRPVGRKIFMQGGVCYNRAVPAAMAVLCGQQIVVPPEPGLMGAFGAALEIQGKIERGQAQRQRFDLAQLAGREVDYRQPFVCNGGKEKCDRKCTIARVVIDGRIHPFGGACNRYYNLRLSGIAETAGSDLVALREELVFRKYSPPNDQNKAGETTVGLLPSLLGSTFHPLYAHFFVNLGLRVVTPAEPEPGGMEAAGAAFCHPVILSHGFLRTLLNKGVDYVFLPHVKNVATGKEKARANCTCPFVQGEPYYLKAAFHNELAPRLLTALLDFEDPRGLRQAFAELGLKLGFSRSRAASAFERAWQVFSEMRREMLNYGRDFLKSLSPEETAIVLFGRSYNAFNRFGNLGIPYKFASRGLRVIPHDFLPLEGLEESEFKDMYWTSGRQILQAAALLHRLPNLFGVYITSFSCGPDSFLIGYFRETMGQKPSLVLELDAHTADAGVDTRIEAFLDVTRAYRAVSSAPEEKGPFTPACLTLRRGKTQVRTNTGRSLSLADPSVKVLLPSMGDTASRAVAAAFRFTGINAVAAPPPGKEELNLGKAIATCKECLPLLLTAGSLRRYIENELSSDEVLLYFMPISDGPCRLGQYRRFLENYLIRNRISNVAFLSLNCENGYAGLSNRFTRRAWEAIAISDGLDDIYAGILALAADHKEALKAFEAGKTRILKSLETDNRPGLLKTLREEMANLSRVDRKISPSEATRVTLLGEIFVRRDGFSRQDLVERLAGRGIMVRTAGVAEWLHYSDYCAVNGIASGVSWSEKLAVRLKHAVKRREEAVIRRLLTLSGFYHPEELELHEIISRSASLLNPRLATEATLTVGATLMELGDNTHGVISIGPFGCMPCRIAEAILACRMESEKPMFSKHNGSFWVNKGKQYSLPFLAIESDGNPFPQLVEERLESFIMAAHRLRESLKQTESLPLPEVIGNLGVERMKFEEFTAERDKGGRRPKSRSAL